MNSASTSCSSLCVARSQKLRKFVLMLDSRRVVSFSIDVFKSSRILILRDSSVLDESIMLILLLLKSVIEDPEDNGGER